MFAACLRALWPTAALLAAVGFFAAEEAARLSFPLDDAWIHRVYARAFAAGDGLAYNAGVQEAGSTSPLWAIVSSPAHWVGGTGAVIAVKGIGTLLALVTALCLLGCGRRLLAHGADGRAPVAPLIAACLFAFEPRLSFSALSGMETNLLIALWLGATVALCAGRLSLAAGLAGLMPTARPEALLVLPLFATGLWLLWRRRSSGSSTPRLMGHLALLAAPSLAWSLFCLAVNGHPLPTTFYLKAGATGVPADNLVVAWQIITRDGFASLPLFKAGLFACVVLLFGVARVRTGGGDARSAAPLPLLLGLLLVAGPLVYGLSVGLSRGLSPGGYYWSRWLDPAALVWTGASCLGLGSLLDGSFWRAFGRSGPRRWAVRACGVAAGLALLLGVPFVGGSALERRAQLASDGRAVDAINVRAGRWVARNTSPDAVLGVNDAGAIRYFGNRRTIDLMGLNHSSIAFGDITFEQSLARCDWLAVFPKWFEEAESLDLVEDAFATRQVVEIDPEAYTVCNCPGQARLQLMQRRRP